MFRSLALLDMSALSFLSWVCAKGVSSRDVHMAFQVWSVHRAFQVGFVQRTF